MENQSHTAVVAAGNPANGIKAVLTKSTTAIRDDMLSMQADKIVERTRLKDTVQSIAHTAKQTASGKYQSTVLMRTKGTAGAGNAEIAEVATAGMQVTQKMQSSRISSAGTARIAAKTIGGKLTGKALASAARNSGAIGAAVSGGIEVLSAGKDLLNGKIDGGEFTGRVVKEAAGGGLSAAAGGAAATFAATTTAALLATTAAPVWIPAAVGLGAAVAVGSAAKSIWDSIWD